MRIITDSRSAVQRLSDISQTTLPSSSIDNDIMDSLEKFHRQQQLLTVVWCPGHCGVPGKEAADKCADEGTKKDQTNFSLSLDTAKTVIKRHIRDPPITHPLVRSIFMDHLTQHQPRDDHLSRQQQVEISRLRSGHHPDLNHWRHKIGLTSDDTCRGCGRAPETTQHIFEQCPILLDCRSEGFSLTSLRSDPLASLRLFDIWKGRVMAIEPLPDA